jgi:hypothetical protein
MQDVGELALSIAGVLHGWRGTFQADQAFAEQQVPHGADGRRRRRGDLAMPRREPVEQLPSCSDAPRSGH